MCIGTSEIILLEGQKSARIKNEIYLHIIYVAKLLQDCL